MAPRTLASTWRQFEKLAKSYLNFEQPVVDDAEPLRGLAVKVNKSRIVDALATMFVAPYAGLEETKVQFFETGDAVCPEWVADYDEEADRMSVNPVGVVQFSRQCEAAFAALSTPEARRDFETYRLRAYMAELRKLPTRLLLFMLILRKVAEILKITEVEKRGGETEDVNDGGYMNLLWGFKEVERMYREMKGVSLRAEYGLLWYESDWYVGKN
ncbi:MAG: hypothetical protein HN904_08325 [Victivallales bacterium]|jgi:hypothetical protein|nr:hypothetical protein [Victivallales bacterium]